MLQATASPVEEVRVGEEGEQGRPDEGADLEEGPRHLSPRFETESQPLAEASAQALGIDGGGAGKLGGHGPPMMSEASDRRKGSGTYTVRTLADACVLLLVPDLFFLAKVASTARDLGIRTVSLLPGEDAAAAIRRHGARALIVDLGLEGADPVAAATSVRADPEAASVRIVGFFSHVEIARRDRALAAGFDLVLPRSKFSADLPFILRDLSAGRTPGNP